jgi:hypothetical protein
VTGASNHANLAYTGTLTGGTGVINIGSGQLYKDASGNVGIGTSSLRSNFGGGLTPRFQIESTEFANARTSITRNSANAGAAESFFAKTRGTANGQNTIVQNSDGLGGFSFWGADGTNLQQAASITSAVDGSTISSTSMPGRLVFSTTASGSNTPTERMRIDSSGNLLVGTTSSGFYGARQHIQASTCLDITNTASSAFGIGIAIRRTDSAGGEAMRFVSNTSTVGFINTTSTSTSYLTSSDYRLKEDWQPMSGAITRLSQLKPVNFAWKVNGSRVDGFLAHEAQEVVPEAVTGTKDAVDKDGKPEYQGIDQSKLVPLLTAALQEAVAKIAALEARQIGRAHV